MPEADALLIQLIVSFQSAAMLQMGKIMNPVTGKVERDLVAAQQTIELLAMLQRKTEGNLTDDEKRYLDHVLYELRMNYVDETERPAESKPSEEEDTAARSEGESQAPDSPDSGSASEATNEGEKPA